MNILTFDIEEWALARNGGYGSPEKYAQYDTFLERILDLLDQTDTKATFFCTGQMAEFFPTVVQKIHSRGHEIGCHSYCHTWMNKMNYKSAEADTKMAVDAIEQCIGEKVLCYRAPAFSIGESNKWMFEILASCGITCDASVFPAKRDFGGFPGFQAKEPCVVCFNGVTLKEFPICMAELLGKNMAYSGGGYFRLFPLTIIFSTMKRSNYTMCYFHINDLMPEKKALRSRKEYEDYFKEPGTIKNRYIRYFKANVGKTGAWSKLTKLVTSNEFYSIQGAVREIGWNYCPVIKL